MSRPFGTVLIATTLLGALAILGYVTGHGRSSAATPRSFTVANSTVTIRYPPSWSRAAVALSIPGVTFKEPLLLAPTGSSRRAGLIAGRLAHTTASPLPTQLVSNLRKTPSTEVVGLLSAEAFRYPEIDVGGLKETVTLYSIPAAQGDATGIACYASRGSAAYLQECDQMVATLVLQTPSNSDVLAPSQAYAKQLEAAIASIDNLRVKLRARLADKPTRATVALLARRLADGFVEPLAALGSAQPPPVASSLQLTLIEAMTRTQDAYAGLASAATLRSPTRYAAARGEVSAAEARLGETLSEFHLIGY